MSLLINKNPLIILHNVFYTILRLIIFVLFTNIDIEKLLQINRLTKLLIKNRILPKININVVFSLSRCIRYSRHYPRYIRNNTILHHF